MTAPHDHPLAGDEPSPTAPTAPAGTAERAPVPALVLDDVSVTYGQRAALEPQRLKLGLDVLEFLARVLDHVPDPGQQLLRYWGWYSNAARGRRERIEGRASAAPAGDSATDPDEVESRRRRLTWSRLIRKVYELDPLLCPCCGSQLEIVAFVVDWVSLRRLLTHLGFAPQQPEPFAHAPPHDTEPRRAHA